MKTNNNIPAYRFQGYTDAWELRKLGELCDIRTGKLDANAMVENGEYDFYTSGIKKYRIDVAEFEGPAITIAGNGATVGYMHLADGKFNAYQRTYVLTNFKVDRSYIFSEIAKKLPIKIQQEARTGNIPYIVLSMLTELSISLPSLPEQSAIGTFFSTLDQHITLHQRKLDTLKEQKKTYLKLLFPAKGQTKPALRFQGFEDDWKEVKLGEFVDKAVDNRGKTPPLDEEGTHPLIEVAALGGVHPDYTKIDKYLNDESFENNLRSYVKKDDILFTTVGSIGLVSLMDSREEAAIAQNIVAFRAKDNFVPSYLYSLFTNKENQKKAIRIVMGAVQPSIKVSQLVGVEYMLTQNRVEQEAIGIFFQTLDQEIAQVEDKLASLKEMKKTLLRKLFVS